MRFDRGIRRFTPGQLLRMLGFTMPGNQLTPRQWLLSMVSPDFKPAAPDNTPRPPWRRRRLEAARTARRQA